LGLVWFLRLFERFPPMPETVSALAVRNVIPDSAIWKTYK
jgi:hypothetical protein